MRAAMLQRQLIIVGHAPRTYAEVGIVSEIALLGFEEKRMRSAEVALNALLVIGIRGHAHDAYDVSAGIVAPLARLQESLALGKAEAILCFLRRHMELEQAGNTAATLLRLTVDFGKQFGRIDRMNERHVGSDVLHLIGLQVANEMPGYVGRECCLLVAKLLHAAFAEVALTGSVGFGNGLHSVVLRHSDKRGTGWQRGAHTAQVVSNSGHGQLVFGRLVGHLVAEHVHQ